MLWLYDELNKRKREGQAVVTIISKKPKVSKSSVSFRVETTTAEELKKLKERVKKAGDEVDFKLDESVEEQLLKLIKTANQQLDKLSISTTV